MIYKSWLLLVYNHLKHIDDAFDLLLRDAWKELEGTDKEAAMQQYIDLMADLKADWDN